MSEIWTPESLTPDGWDPDEWYDVNSFHPSREKSTVLRGRILFATYHKEHRSVAVQILTPDDERRVACLGAKCFTFEGKSLDEAPEEVVDREMTILARLFNEKANREDNEINIKMFSTQI